MSEDIRKMIDNVKNFKQFVNEDIELRKGKSVYGIISNGKIIDKIIATNVEEAYKKYKNLDFYADITIERNHDETIDGVKYKSYVGYETNNKTHTMIFFILIDENF